MRALFSTSPLQQPDESSLVSSTVADLLTLATLTTVYQNLFRR